MAGSRPSEGAAPAFLTHGQAMAEREAEAVRAPCVRYVLYPTPAIRWCLSCSALTMGTSSSCAQVEVDLQLGRSCDGDRPLIASDQE